MSHATFHTNFANEFLDALGYSASSWMTTYNSHAVPLGISDVYAVLRSTSGNGLASFPANAADVIAYTDVANWSAAVGGAKSVEYTFSSVVNAGAPLECVIACLSSGTFYPMCVGSVTASGGGGMLIGSTASYSSGNRSYRATLVVPADNGGTLRLNTQLRNALLNQMVSGSGAGAAPSLLNGGTLRFYDGTQPDSADDAVPGGSTLLAEYATSGSVVTPPSGRTLYYPNSVHTLDGSANASGTATWARLTKSSYALDFGVDATVGDIVISTAFSSGAAKTWTINAMTLTWP